MPCARSNKKFIFNVSELRGPIRGWAQAGGCWSFTVNSEDEPNVGLPADVGEGGGGERLLESTTRAQPSRYSSL